ncbi:GNAT family N-acetyltransferase [Demequina aestuarii]|uniref:GNAT family N-acetyltransferase n=1 Tax=Demequina aestuarii TaxID=327095 RepID=UPI000782A064|nr:GNAT family N-acetyltransferase [Demequina aestuarii]
MGHPVPRRIDTERLTLRCYEPADLDSMSAVITAERDRLAVFMPWARSEPISPRERAEVVATFIREFDERENFTFGMFDRQSGEYVGSTGMHTRLGPDAFEIGYWIRADREGTGLIREAVAAQTWVALETLGAAWVEIRCDPANARSRRVPDSLGFTLADTRVDACGADQHREFVEIWQLSRDALSASAVASMPRPMVGAPREGAPWTA